MLVPQIPLIFLLVLVMLMLLMPEVVLVLLRLIIHSSRPDPFPDTMQLPTDFLRGGPDIRIAFHYSLNLVPDLLSPRWGVNIGKEDVPEVIFWQVWFWVEHTVDVVVMSLVRQFRQYVLDKPVDNTCFLAPASNVHVNRRCSNQSCRQC
jgi:hypothetical protein